MKRLVLWGLLLVLPARSLAQVNAVVLTDPQQRLLTDIENYIDTIHSLKGRFSQTGPDGKVLTGTVWLERPGRMRFEYDLPSPLLLVADHGTVIFHDGQLGQTTNMPAAQTPLGLLLGDKIRFSGDVTVTGFEQPPNAAEVTLVRTKQPGEGSLTLFLTLQPMTLNGWSVVDPQGKETQLHLNQVQFGLNFDQSLFTFSDPDTDK